MAVLLSDLLGNLAFNRSVHCTQVSDLCPLGLLFDQELHTYHISIMLISHKYYDSILLVFIWYTYQQKYYHNSILLVFCFKECQKEKYLNGNL